MLTMFGDNWFLNDKTYGNSKRTWDTVEQIGDDERLDGEVALGQAQTKAGGREMVMMVIYGQDDDKIKWSLKQQRAW